jgi:nucleoside-diphosphate-sugar epimerase
MKVMVTGGTGLVGSNILKKCIDDPRITSVLALSRRELPAELTDNEKVKVIISKDFSKYPNELLEQLEGAEACLWQVTTMIYHCFVMLTMIGLWVAWPAISQMWKQQKGCR